MIVGSDGVHELTFHRCLKVLPVNLRTASVNSESYFRTRGISQCRRKRLHSCAQRTGTSSGGGSKKHRHYQNDHLCSKTAGETTKQRTYWLTSLIKSYINIQENLTGSAHKCHPFSTHLAGLQSGVELVNVLLRNTGILQSGRACFMWSVEGTGDSGALAGSLPSGVGTGWLP